MTEEELKKQEQGKEKKKSVVMSILKGFGSVIKTLAKAMSDITMGR